MGSLLLSPGSWCIQGIVCALQESISQSCVSSDSSMVELMVMPYPSLLHPELLFLWQSTTDPYIHRRCSNTVLSQSLWGSWVLACTRFEPSEHLWQEWGLILKQIHLSYHLPDASPLPLGMGYHLTKSYGPNKMVWTEFVWI